MMRLFVRPPTASSALLPAATAQAWPSSWNQGPERRLMSWVICIFSGLLMPTEKNSFGEPSEKGFRKALSRMSVTVKNEDTREKDMMSCTDFYNYHGGLTTAVHPVTGSRPFSLAGDS